MKLAMTVIKKTQHHRNELLGKKDAKFFTEVQHSFNEYQHNTQHNFRSHAWAAVVSKQ